MPQQRFKATQQAMGDWYLSSLKTPNTEIQNTTARAESCADLTESSFFGPWRITFTWPP